MKTFTIPNSKQPESEITLTQVGKSYNLKNDPKAIDKLVADARKRLEKRKKSNQ